MSIADDDIDLYGDISLHTSSSEQHTLSYVEVFSSFIFSFIHTK